MRVSACKINCFTVKIFVFDRKSHQASCKIACSILFYCVPWNFPFNDPGVDADAANRVMDLIRDEFVSGDIASLPSDGSGIDLKNAEEFA